MARATTGAPADLFPGEPKFLTDVFQVITSARRVVRRITMERIVRRTATKFRFLLPLMMLGMAAAACSVATEQETTGEYVDSATISTKVKTKLASEGGMTLANQVKVETVKDVVQLSGFVPTEADRTKAEQIAWSVEGVRAVRNDIIVQP